MSTLRDYDYVQEQRKDQARRIARRQLVHQAQKHNRQHPGRYQAMIGWLGRHLVSWGQQMQAGADRLEHSR